MWKQNTVNFKWQKQISSVSQVSNLIIFHETPLTAGVHTRSFQLFWDWGPGPDALEEVGFWRHSSNKHPMGSLPKCLPQTEITSLPFLKKGCRGFCGDPSCFNCGWNLLPNTTGEKAHSLSAWGTVEKRRGGHYASGGEGACAELELHLVVLNQTSLSQPPSAMIWGPWHKLCS